MTTIKQLQAVASVLLTEKLKCSEHLKNELDNKLNIVNNQTNGQIYNLCNELEELYHEHKDSEQTKKNNHNTKPPKIKRKIRLIRGRKRKYSKEERSSGSDDNATEPRVKRMKRTQNDDENVSTKHNLTMRRTSASSSTLSSSIKKHNKLTIRTTSSSVSSHHMSKDTSPCDSNGHYLYKMLKNAKKAHELTQQNIALLQECIDSVEVFEDILEGGIMELGDEIRKTFQEFPFKSIPPSYHQKTLQQQLRLNRMLHKYPDLEQTELDIYKLQSDYVSQYAIRSVGEQEIVSDLDDDNVINNVRNNNLMDSDHEDNKWCICEQPSNGKMIRCDNKLCLIQWFHWKCVRIMKVPKDKWYCKPCRKYRTKSNLLHPKFTKKQKK